MRIGIEWFPGERPQFNVTLSTAAGKEPFITIKGCRIVDGSNGPFVSWPAKKLETGKWRNHVYTSEAFGAAVLQEAEKARPKAQAKAPASPPADDDDDVPF